MMSSHNTEVLGQLTPALLFYCVAIWVCLVSMNRRR